MSKAHKLAHAVTTLICIRKVPGSNLARNTKYPEIHHNVPQPLQANPETLPQIPPWRFLPNSVQYIIYYPSYHLGGPV